MWTQKERNAMKVKHKESGRVEEVVLYLKDEITGEELYRFKGTPGYHGAHHYEIVETLQ